MTPPPAAAALRPSRVSALIEVGVLALVAAMVVIRLRFPFTGDQALFAAGADLMHRGGRLYVDLWDAKQPGIYVWFATLGRVFGRGTAAVHLAEAVHAVVAARLVQVLLRERVRHRGVAAVAPLLSVGALYAPARAWDLTQVETLAALPLLAVAAALLRAPASGRRRTWCLLAAGLAAAWVGWLKLLYLPIPLAMATAAVFASGRAGSHALRRQQRRRRWDDAGSVGAGTLVGLAPLGLYAVANGLVGELWWSWFVYPSQSQRVDPPPLGRLADALHWELRVHGWLVALALLGVVALGARRRTSAGTNGAGTGTDHVEAVAPERDPLVAMSLVWLVLGSLAVLTQKWWGYHFCLLVVPLGLLAAIGVDRALTVLHDPARRQQAGPARVVLLGALSTVGVVAGVFPALELAHVTRVVAEAGFGADPVDRLRIETRFEAYTPDAVAAARAAPGPPGAPVHVMGNPIIQWRSGRPFAIALNGWSPEQFTPRLWARNRDQLASARAQGTIAALWIDRTSEQLWRERSPDTWNWVRRAFRADRSVADGTWYVAR